MEQYIGVYQHKQFFKRVTPIRDNLRSLSGFTD